MVQQTPRRHPFVALSHLASQEDWCWHIGCTTCSCREFRYGFLALARGHHPDSASWPVRKGTIHIAERDPLPWMGPESNTIEQSALLSLLGSAPLSQVHSVAKYPDWLGYIGLVLFLAGSLERRERIASAHVVNELLRLVPAGEIEVRESLQSIVGLERRALQPSDLELVESVIPAYE